MNKLKYLSGLAAGIVLAFSQNASAVTVNTVDYGVATIQPTVIPPSGMNINNLVFGVTAYNTRTLDNFTAPTRMHPCRAPLCQPLCQFQRRSTPRSFRAE